MTINASAETQRILARAARQRQRARGDWDSVVLEPPWELSRTLLARDIAAVLFKHYPKHRWAVGFPSHRDPGEGCLIRDLDIPTRFTLFIRPSDLDAPSYRNIVRRAGEYLEAYNLSRSRRPKDRRAEVHELHARAGPSGLILPDLDALTDNNRRNIPYGQLSRAA